MNRYSHSLSNRKQASVQPVFLVYSWLSDLSVHSGISGKTVSVYSLFAARLAWLSLRGCLCRARQSSVICEATCPVCLCWSAALNIDMSWRYSWHAADACGAAAITLHAYIGKVRTLGEDITSPVGDLRAGTDISHAVSWNYRTLAGDRWPVGFKYRKPRSRGGGRGRSGDVFSVYVKPEAANSQHGNLSDLQIVDRKRYVVPLASIIYRWRMRRVFQRALTCIWKRMSFDFFPSTSGDYPLHLQANVSSLAS